MPKNYQMVTAAERKQMAGLLNHYRKSPHPFSQCVRDNRQRFGPRAEEVCAVVKDLIEGGIDWRKGSK